MKTRYCGPAHAEFVLAGKRHVVRGGTCEIDQRKHSFSLGVGWNTNPWPGKPHKGLYFEVSITRYNGAGVYPIAGNRVSVRIVLTPYYWQTWGDRLSQREGAPMSWAVGKVTIAGRGAGGTFAVRVETPPGGANDTTTRLPAYLSVPAVGSFSCS